MTESNEIYCWGYNGAGSSTAKLVLGQNDDTQRNQPGPTIADPAGGAVNWARMGSGMQNNCAITTSGATYCWGDGDTKVNGVTSHEYQPQPISGINLRKITVNADTACGISTTDVLYIVGAMTTQVP